MNTDQYFDARHNRRLASEDRIAPRSTLSQKGERSANKPELKEHMHYTYKLTSHRSGRRDEPQTFFNDLSRFPILAAEHRGQMARSLSEAFDPSTIDCEHSLEKWNGTEWVPMLKP